MNYLWEKIVGSHIWKMDHPQSDLDIWRVYCNSTYEILRGKINPEIHHHSHHSFVKEDASQYKDVPYQHNEIVDVVTHEIGTVIEQLLKGNLNFLIGVLSPITLSTSFWYETLETIVRTNLAKNCYNSIRSMVFSNWKKYIASGKDNSLSRCSKVYRTLMFGINLLNGDIKFEPCKFANEEMITRGLDTLKEALENSKLPEKPNENPFRDFLFAIRFENLQNF